MPVKRTTKHGRPAYQWGDNGKRYSYEPGNKQARERAKRRARKQGRAARASGYEG